MEDEHVLTPRAQDVLVFASYYSSPDKPRPVEPEHILLALLQIDPELFQLLLGKDADQVIAALREDLRAFNPSIYQSWGATESPPWSPGSKEVMRLAAEQNKWGNNPTIATEHLLLGLISSHSTPSDPESKRSYVSQILIKRGLTLERVAPQVGSGSLTKQVDYADRSAVLRHLPASRRPRFTSLFRFIQAALDHFRIVFAIVIMLGWAIPLQPHQSLFAAYAIAQK